MRIALDATPLTLTSGGLRRYVEDLSLALAREFPDDRYTLLSDQTFHPPSGAPANLSAVTRQDRRYWLFGIRRALHELDAEIFHGTNYEVPYLGRTPAVLTIHDLSPWRNPEWHPSGAKRVRQRTPWLVRLGRARFILTVSNAVAREIVSHFGVSEDRVRAVPLAASPLFHPAIARPVAGQKPYFLFVGTLEPRKGLSTLLEAWRETREQTSADLIIAGRMRADFVPIPKQEGLSIIGEVRDADLPRLYSNALAFVYPTQYEGFGLPVLEAMQCGCPVITSRDPAVMEVSGGAALHAGSGAELAAAMVAVASNAELHARLSANGLSRANTFSWQATARQTRAVYEEAVRRRD